MTRNNRYKESSKNTTKITTIFGNNVLKIESWGN